MSKERRRRASDFPRFNVRENWYRDLWLLAISAVVVLALFGLRDAVSQIQQSRLAACQAQNLRHDRTLATLDTEVARYEQGASPARRAQLRASRASSVALINQLSPHQNCKAVVHRTTVRRHS